MRLSWMCLGLMFVFLVAVPNGASLKIASFNIKWLDERKVNDHAISGVLTKILGRYDLILIEEIRGNPQDVITKLVTLLNSHTSSPYSFKVSGPEGRTNYKEEYAYIYRTSEVTVRAAEQYSDRSDEFEREPYIINVHLAHTHSIHDFIFVGIHTKPDKTKAEIANLVHVYNHVVSKYGIHDVLLAGDMNAGCNYMKDSDITSNPLHSSTFTWLIDSSVDTTVSTHTHCAYDRFVVAGSKLKAAVVHGSAKPYNYQQELGLSFEEAWAVSDHYPIEFHIQ